MFVSYNDLFNWKNTTEVFREIKRILRPGGRAVIYCGFYSKKIKKNIFSDMDKESMNELMNKISGLKTDKIKLSVSKSGIKKFTVNRDPSGGIWIKF